MGGYIKLTISFISIGVLLFCGAFYYMKTSQNKEIPQKEVIVIEVEPEEPILEKRNIKLSEDKPINDEHTKQTTSAAEYMQFEKAIDRLSELTGE